MHSEHLTTTIANENELYLNALFDGCSESDFAMRSKCANDAKFIQSVAEVTIPVILNCFCLSHCGVEVIKRPATCKILLEEMSSNFTKLQLHKMFVMLKD